MPSRCNGRCRSSQVWTSWYANGHADAASVLFANHLKFDASQPNWPDRDRFVLSAGHGSMLLYALLYLTGYKDTTLDALRNFRQLAVQPLAILNMAMLPALKPRQARWGRALPMRWVWRWPGICAANLPISW